MPSSEDPVSDSMVSPGWSWRASMPRYWKPTASGWNEGRWMRFKTLYCSAALTPCKR